MTTTIVSRIFAPEPGAAPQRLLALAQALVRAGQPVRVITASLPLPSEEPYDSDGMAVRRAWVKRNNDGYVRGYVSYLSFDVPAFFRVLFGPRCDGYVVEPPPTTAAVVRVVAAIRRTPYVYYAADVWSDATVGIAGSTVARVVRGIERWAMKGAAMVLAVSPEVATRVRELGVDRPMEVVGFGIDTDVFRPLGGAPLDTPTFVYTGTFSERHGAEVFAAALGMLLDERPGSARLEFYGTGTDTAQILEACPERHRGSIVFHAPVPAGQIARIMSRATAGLASVKPEHGYDYAFATKTLALMATGCPVIYAGPGPAAKVVAEASQVHRACRSVEFDATTVADAMRAILDSPRPASERLQLAQWIHERHSARATADHAAAVVLGALGA